MNMNFARTVSRAAALLVFCFASSLHAQDIDLVGNVSWFKLRRTVEIIAERIENNREAGRSGTLALQIWATTDVYNGGDLVGYPIGTLHLRPLRAGSAYVQIDYFVRYKAPPPGLYFTTITLEEFTADGYVIVDYENFPGIVNFGGWGHDEAFVNGTNGDVGFNGDVSWESGGGRVRLSAQQILNERDRATGPLRLELFATSTPYGGGVLQGELLARRALGRLRAGHPIDSFSRRAFFFAPPEGTYYTTLALEEFQRGNGWVIVDYVTFPNTSLF